MKGLRDTMIRENERREKMCLFFVSDYHFEMISLPFINKELNDDKNVVVMTENSLDDTVDELLSKINLNQNDRDKLKGIDWSANDFTKLNDVKCASEDVKVIDCYDINEVHDDVSHIVKSYGQVLSTSGIEKLL